MAELLSVKEYQSPDEIHEFEKRDLDTEQARIFDALVADIESAVPEGLRINMDDDDTEWGDWEKSGNGQDDEDKVNVRQGKRN